MEPLEKRELEKLFVLQPSLPCVGVGAGLVPRLQSIKITPQVTQLYSACLSWAEICWEGM